MGGTKPIAYYEAHSKLQVAPGGKAMSLRGAMRFTASFEAHGTYQAHCKLRHSQRVKTTRPTTSYKTQGERQDIKLMASHRDHGKPQSPRSDQSMSFMKGQSYEAHGQLKISQQATHPIAATSSTALPNYEARDVTKIRGSRRTRRPRYATKPTK